MIAAFLYSQLENMDKINQKRIDIWNEYHEFFKQFEDVIKRPYCPEYCQHNAHMYYLLFKDLETRTMFIDYMKQNDVSTVFHYIPLHSSPAGQKYCRTYGKMDVTNEISDTLVRLPMFYELDDESLKYIINSAKSFIEDKR